MVARSGMGRTGETRLVSWRWVVVAALAWLAAAPSSALAIRFGQNDAVEVRGKFYSQFTVATEVSEEYTQPTINAGDMKQWRNFYNPELEVDFRKLTGWRGFFSDFSGRLAIWGFYDGLYDVGPERYRQNLALTKKPRRRRGVSTRRATRSSRLSTTRVGGATAASSTAGAPG